MPCVDSTEPVADVKVYLAIFLFHLYYFEIIHIICRRVLKGSLIMGALPQ